jgi:hypothetical protein
MARLQGCLLPGHNLFLGLKMNAKKGQEIRSFLG